jgi:precorrin-2 dehydrogenase / sirohydrochlorin ferrochelatase
MPPTHPLPVFLSLVGRRVLVVGGGPVGRRKAAAALAAGAAVRVVALEPRPDGFDDPSLEWVVGPYGPEFLTGMSLVFAATSADENRTIIADAQAQGLWICDSSVPERGSFVLPGIMRAGALTIGVSTGGAAPALTRRVKEKLQTEFDASFRDWVDLLAELRPEVRDGISDTATRRMVFDTLADWPWLERVRREGIDAVRAAMREFIQRTIVTDRDRA